MTKEQQIYKNMKRPGHIKKAYGKWCISYSKLIKAIIDTGYSRDTADKIIENMLARGYIRESRNINGKTATEQGLKHSLSGYIITKWIN